MKFTKIILILFLILLSSVAAQSNTSNSGGLPSVIERVELVEEVIRIKEQPPRINVFGTEYNSGDAGNIFLQTLDSGGIPIINSTCDVTAYYPNITSKFIDNQMMLPFEKGIHYFTFVVPEQEGVYMVIAECTYFTERKFYYEPDKLEAPNETLIFGDEIIGHPIVLTDYKDGLYSRVESVQDGTNRLINVEYAFQVDNAPNMSLPRIAWTGESNSEPLISISAYNWTSNSFVDLSTTKVLSASVIPSVNIPTGSNEIIVNDVPMDMVNSTNGMRFRLKANHSFNFILWSNFLNVISSELLTTSESHLRGGGELHVTNGLPDFEVEVNELEALNAMMLLTIVMLGIGITLTFIGKNFLSQIVASFSFLASFFLLQSASYETIALIPFILAFVSLIKGLRLKTSETQGSSSIYVE